jgi:hypothetical protein
MSSIALGVATVAVGAGTAIYGANQQKKTSEANQQNSEKYLKAIQQNEREARKLFDGFMEGYNASKERLAGMSLQDYIGRQVQALNDPYLNEAFRKSKDADWEQAQRFADEGSTQNASIFNRIVDEVGGGNYKELLARRDAAVMGEDIKSLYAEARRLQAPKQMAGSVRRNEDGEVIGGQRGDKFEFDISTTAIKEQNDRMFEKSRTAIEDDRVAAARQQDRAIQFLPMLDYSSFANNAVVQPFNQAKLSSELAMLQAEANMAANAMSMAFSKPLAPAQMSNPMAGQLMAGGTQMALGGIADLYKDSRTSNPNATGASASRGNADSWWGRGAGINPYA